MTLPLQGEAPLASLLAVLDPPEPGTGDSSGEEEEDSSGPEGEGLLKVSTHPNTCAGCSPADGA